MGAGFFSDAASENGSSERHFAQSHADRLQNTRTGRGGEFSCSRIEDAVDGLHHESLKVFPVYIIIIKNLFLLTLKYLSLF